MSDYYGKYTSTKVVFSIGSPVGAGGVAVDIPGFAALSISSGRGADAFTATDRATPLFTVTVGADGDTSHSKSNDKTAPITLVLMDGSGFNTALSVLFAAWEDENVPHFTVPISVIDLNSNPPSIVVGRNAVLERPAPLEKGAASGENTWTFLPAETTIVHNGRVF